MSRDRQSLIGCQTFSTEKAEEPFLHADTQAKRCGVSTETIRRMV